MYTLQDVSNITAPDIIVKNRESLHKKQIVSTTRYTRKSVDDLLDKYNKNPPVYTNELIFTQKVKSILNSFLPLTSIYIWKSKVYPFAYTFYLYDSGKYDLIIEDKNLNEIQRQLNLVNIKYNTNINVPNVLRISDVDIPTHYTLSLILYLPT